MWLGVNPKGQDMLFDVPKGYAQELVATAREGSAYRVVEGHIKGRLGNAAWFTNLDHAKRHEELILYKRYSPDAYPGLRQLRCDQRKQGGRNPDGLGWGDGGAGYIPGQI